VLSRAAPCSEVIADLDDVAEKVYTRDRRAGLSL